MADARELVIGRVGAQGDGVAVTGEGDVFVPFTLAGETVLAEVRETRGKLKEVLVASPDRIAPVCPHFGVCGGCAVQQMRSDVYAAWKRDLVVSAFAARGIETEVQPLLNPGGHRRRAVFTAARDGALKLGFYAAQSHDLIDVDVCPVLHPRIVAAMPALREFLPQFASKTQPLRVTVTLTDAGLDVQLGDVRGKLTPVLRARIAEGATAMAICRVVIDGEIVFEALAPFLMFGATRVDIPPGIFIQAVSQAEAEMAKAAVAATVKAKHVVDLFSGAGALSFPLARHARVTAFDSDKVAIAALSAATRKATHIKPVIAAVRDLFREPLSARELAEFDAIVFDPPRAGAEAQSRAIAKSKVKSVVAVSCNPATLARDVRILLDGGYRLTSVQPIDQFRYSPHIEAVAVLER